MQKEIMSIYLLPFEQNGTRSLVQTD